jgi:hypothetical protein
MDPLLFLILIPLVILIGYILSRPFENPADYQVGTSPKNELQEQYDSLLHEIRMMQREVEDSDHPEDIQNQIESKKRQAARLLRQLNPTLDS